MKNKGLKATSCGILLLLVAMIVAVPLLWIYISLPTTTYAAQNLEYDSSNVLEDLMSSEVIQNGQSKPFNLMDYPKNELARSPKLINVIEYCYSARKTVRSHYGLYLYIYNPQLITFDDTSVQNKVQLAVSYDEEGKPKDYEKFDLQFCNRSVMAGTERLFYKYKVIDKKSFDGKYIIDRVKSSERRYDISGFELLTKDKTGATDYTVGGTYKYSGYAQGCGADPNAESDLKCKVTDLETIRIKDIHNAFWRSQTSSSGMNYQDEIASVYFTVDNKVFEDYGTLQKIRASWYQYKTQPILVTSNSEIENIIKPYVGKRIGDYDSSVPFMLYSNMVEIPNGSGDVNKYCDWSFNFSQTTKPTIQASEKVAYQIPFVFSTSGNSIANYAVQSDEILKYIYSYNASFIDGTVPSKTAPVSADLFERYAEDGFREENVDAGDTFNLITSDLMAFFEFGLKGFNRDKYPNYKNIKPIEVFESDVAFSDNVGTKYYFDDTCVSDFKQLCSSSLGKKVVVFRYGVRDYYSVPKVKLWKTGYTDFGEIDGAYIAQEYVDLDFDIIDLTFNKSGVYTVIPVVASPIDIVSKVTPPIEKDSLLDWVKRILVIIVLIVVLIVLAPVLPYILKFVVWVITLPFRAIGWLVKSIKKKQ